MKRLIILLALITICHNADDCTDFESQVITSCEALGSSSGSNICIYSDNRCIPSFKECSDYNPSTSFVDSTCTLITPSDGKYKCVVKADGSTKKTCEPELKVCAEHDANDDCINLKAETGQRCVLFNGQCKAHYETCSELSKETCSANIPKDTSTKCVWNSQSNSCGPSDRVCEDYIVYEDKYLGDTVNRKTCQQLTAETNKVCVFFDNKECKQYYDSCGKGDEDQALCGNIKPLNAGKTGFDPLYKCFYSDSDSSCKKEPKECSDFESGKDDKETCENLAASENKMCYYNSAKDKCLEIYETCTSYNLVETDSNKRTSTICEEIIPRIEGSEKTEDQSSICFLDEDDENKCKSRKRKCEEIQKEGVCNNQALEDKNKRCLFTGSKCIEIYKTCDLYQENVSNKNKGDCEIIEPNYADQLIYKCEFNEKNQECSKKKLKCEEYLGQDEDYCKSLKVNLDPGLKCALIGGKCIEQYDICDSYDGKNKTICESIILYGNPYKKCVLLQDKDCDAIDKTCSEYLGDSETECKKYTASVNTRTCILENHKCVEKSIFNYCSDYRGTNKEECESIKPYYTEGVVGLDPSSKCVYTNEGCIKKSKECRESTSESECPTIIPTDENKQCVYIGNACTEQYKTCDLYYSEEDTIDKTICESILIKEDGYTSDKYKCEYKAPASGQAKGTCTRIERSCSDFEPKLIRSLCNSIPLTDFTKRCVFNDSNNSCSPEYKTCSELSTLSSATDEICKNGVPSTNKICVAKSDKSGCEEKEKEEEKEPEPINTTEENQESQPNEEKPSDPNSFAGKYNLNMLVYIAICLLF